MDLRSISEKTREAYEDLKILVQLNHQYLQIQEPFQNKIRFQFIGSGPQLDWFYSHRTRAWTNSVQIEFEFLENESLPRIKFLDLLPFHPNMEEGQYIFINKAMLVASNLQLETSPSHLVAFVWGLLTYQIVDENNVLNFRALEWYKKYRQRFPSTRIVLHLPSTTSGFRIKPKPGTATQLSLESNRREGMHHPDTILNTSVKNERSSRSNLPLQHQNMELTNPSQQRVIHESIPPLFNAKSIQRHIPKKKDFPKEVSYQLANWEAPVVTVRQNAWNKILIHGSSDKTNEQFGILVGGVYENPENGGIWLDIVGMIPAERYHGTPAYVEVSTDEMSEMIRRSESLMESYPDLCRLGWYHTHPGHTIFMSATDKSNHRSVYRANWQTALVYDPRNHLFGFFAGPECWSLPKNNIYILPDGSPTTSLVQQPEYQKAETGWIEPARQKDPRRDVQPVPKKEPMPVLNVPPHRKVSRPEVDGVPSDLQSVARRPSMFSSLWRNVIKPALLVGFILIVAYFGYLLGRTTERRQGSADQSAVLATVSSIIQIAEQTWISSQQSQIIMNVSAQINQKDLDLITRARLIGQLEIAISLDRNSSLAKDAQKLIDRLMAGIQQTPVPTNTLPSPSPTATVGQSTLPSPTTSPPASSTPAGVP